MLLMCIAAPAKIVEIDTESNICAADFGGVRQNAKLDAISHAFLETPLECSITHCGQPNSFNNLISSSI